jgi:hypothetical protein
MFLGICTMYSECTLYNVHPIKEGWQVSVETLLDCNVCGVQRRYLKLLGSPGIDSEESISPAYVNPGGPVRQPYSYSVPSPHRLFSLCQQATSVS